MRTERRKEKGTDYSKKHCSKITTGNSEQQPSNAPALTKGHESHPLIDEATVCGHFLKKPGLLSFKW